MPFLLLCRPEADDPTDGASVSVDADQDDTADLADGPDAKFAIVPTEIGLFKCWAIEQSHGNLEGKSAFSGVSGALGIIPFKVHGKN
jgi:hypothetical protein